MPDVSVSALGRADSIHNGTPTISSKSLTTTTPSTTAAQKSGKNVPRVDIEPIYTALKKALGSHWTTYRDGIGRFVLGTLSQQELARLTDHFVLVDPAREVLHNQLICAIYANALRDIPEPGVASWVSSNDKPAAVVKHVSGDAAEQRLKTEVMQLPPRVRARLKGINDDPATPLVHTFAISRQSSRIASHPPTLLPSTSSTAAPTANLNKDLEIRRRYALPLGSEIHDLPHPATLADRITPICYEEGLPSGPASPEACVELLSIGLEAFVKEVIVSILDRSISNAPISGPPPPTTTTAASAAATTTTTAPATDPTRPDSSASTTSASAKPPAAAPTTSLTGGAVGITSGPRMGILTSAYKRRLSAEEAACARGDIKRTDTGLLPCEVSALKAQRSLDAATMGTDSFEDGDDKLIGVPGDLKLAWELGDAWLKGIAPWMGETLMMEEYYDTAPSVGKQLANGDLVDGIGQTDGVDDMDIDADGERDDADGDEELPDWGWQGAGVTDRAALGALLDDCLAVGQ